MRKNKSLRSTVGFFLKELVLFEYFNTDQLVKIKKIHLFQFSTKISTVSGRENIF